MKKNLSKIEDELQPEYDLTSLLKNGVRGKYAERYRAGTNVVMLRPDVAQAFPTEESVNDALCLVMRMAEIPVCDRRPAQIKPRLSNAEQGA